MTQKLSQRRVSAALPVLFSVLLASIPASAGGSMGLDDVLVAVTSAPKLIAEIHAELKANDLKIEDVTCSGARFGNQWTYLGGGRAAPYECTIGKREIIIDANRTYFDSNGRKSGEYEPRRAKTFQEIKFKWKWQPAP